MRNVVLLMFFLTAAIFVSCGSKTSKDYSSSVSSNDDTEKVDLLKAGIIAQDFVSDKWGKCDFDTEGCRGEETMIKNRFKVLQKFTHKDEPYIYKIYIQYFGGDWADRNNWDYGDLVIENTKTGQQYHFQGTMKSRERQKINEKAQSGIDAAGHHFEIADQREEAIRIYNDEKLSLDEIKKVVIDMRKTKKWKIIQFAQNGKTQAGEEYAAWQYNLLLDIEKDIILEWNPDE